VFIGYPPKHKGYRCFDLLSRRVIVSRHVVFDESIFPYAPPTTATPPATAIAPTFDPPRIRSGIRFLVPPDAAPGTPSTSGSPPVGPSGGHASTTAGDHPSPQSKRTTSASPSPATVDPQTPTIHHSDAATSPAPTCHSGSSTPQCTPHAN
jgi:hypothetical protein